MIPRHSGCQGCPLNTTSVPGFCPDKIPTNTKYVFLAEAPGSTEINKAEPMVGRAGFVLHNWLIRSVSMMKLAWDKGEIGLANVLRCLPKEVQGRPYPKGKDKELAERCCRQYDAWPETAHTYVLFGEHSQRLFFKDELDAEDVEDKALGHTLKGVMGRIGRTYERDGRRYVFGPHPAFILRQPALVQHGQEALKIAVGAERVVEPKYLAWSCAMRELS